MSMILYYTLCATKIKQSKYSKSLSGGDLEMT
jgi:hypothetical protein